MPGSGPDIVELHTAHGGFVWQSLARLGVRSADLDDMLQEVFVVVHRRSVDYPTLGNARSWLYAICVRVASHYRRRAYVRNEVTVDQMPEASEVADNPEQALVVRQRRAYLTELLDQMDVERRAILVMFELDEMPCDQIAGVLGVPLGTVYSRLHAARKEFEKVLARSKAKGGAS